MNKIQAKQEELTIPIPTFSGTDYNLLLKNSTNYVFLGANGSGKSKLGLFIESSLLQSDKSVLRLNAQRMLSIPDKVNILDHKEAKNQLMYGAFQPYFSDSDYRKQKIRNLYSNGQFTNPQNDFQMLLSALFSQHQEIASKFMQKYKNCPSSDIVIESSALDILKELWTKLLPERELVADGYNISIKQHGRLYKPMYMSDGEKILLYLIAQCLLVQEGATIIIDEPEIHINRSILSKLWDLLEEYRKDCIFIYITQDSDFALTRIMSQKLWVKNCNFEIATIQRVDPYNNFMHFAEEIQDQKWELEEINQTSLPEDLLLSLLGNRKKILFIEGEKSSLDKRIYEYVYPDFTIVPCGGCSQVEKMYSAYKDSLFAHIESFAIIDRDRKSDDEVDALKKKGLQVLDFVAEIENVLLLPEILELTINTFYIEQNVEKIQDYIFKEYKYQLESETTKNTVYEVNYFMEIPENIQNLSKIQSLCANLRNHISEGNIENIYKKNKQRIDVIYINKNYLELIKIMNSKNMPTRISKLLGLTDYSEFVLNNLKNNENYRNDFIEILKKYFPQLN